MFRILSVGIVLLFFPVFLFSQTDLVEFIYNGKGDFRDRFQVVVADNSGNSYAGGYTVREDQFTNFLVLKRGPNGQEIWRREYNGLGDNADEIEDMVFDSANNRVVLTGFSNSGAVGNDYWTMAISANGEVVWSALYNNPVSNQYDQPNAIALDGAGNVYVTGDSDVDPTSGIQKDLLTVAYSSTGVFLWSRTFDQASGLDRGEDIAYSSDGVIAIAGRSDNGGDDDYLVLGYNPSGTLLWTILLDSGGIDRATAVATGSDGHIYTTGRFNNGNDDDFYTLKINAAGVIVWTRTFDFVEDDRADVLAIGPNDVIYVAGRSDANATALLNYNIRLVAYSAASTQLWTVQYDGSGAGDDTVAGIVSSSDGSVALTGNIDQAAGATIATDAITLKYNSSGGLTWVKTFAGSAGSDDLAFGVTSHPSGEIETVGSLVNSTNNSSAFTNRYNGPAIDATLTADGTGDNADNARAVSHSLSTPNFIAGYTVEPEQNRNILLIAKANATDTLWTRTLNGSLYGSDDDAVDVEEVADGVLLLGYLRNSGQGSDILLNKYSPTGTLLWSQTYNSAVSESDRPSDMLVASNGNIYIVGRVDTDPSFTTNNQRLLLCYSAAGILQWQITSADGSGDDRSLSITEVNNQLIVGSRRFNGVDFDVEIVAHSFTGAILWSHQFNGGFNDDLESISTYNNADIALSISKYTSGNASSVAVLQLLNATGEVVWTDEFSALGQVYNKPLKSIRGTGTDGNLSYLQVVNHPTDGQGSIEQYSITQTNNQGITISTTTTAASENSIADDVLLVSGLPNDQLALLSHTDQQSGTLVNYDAQLSIWNFGSTSPEIEWSGLNTDSSEVGNIAREGEVFGSKRPSGQRDLFQWSWQWIISVQERLANPFTLYPNPFVDRIYFAQPITGTVSIFDNLGKQIQEEQIVAASEINLQHLKKGVYILSITDKKTRISSKIIKD